MVTLDRGQPSLDDITVAEVVLVQVRQRGDGLSYSLDGLGSLQPLHIPQHRLREDHL